MMVFTPLRGNGRDMNAGSRLQTASGGFRAGLYLVKGEGRITV
jgi:hypothetical protein